MKLNLFCVIIFSLMPNFVYPSALIYDNDVEVIEADVIAKGNITQVKQTDFEGQKKAEEDVFDIQVKFPRHNLTKTKVHFPNDLYKVMYENPCLPSPCGRRNYFHWDDEFQGIKRRICLPNYVKSPPTCNWVCPAWCPADPDPTPCLPSPCGPHSQCRDLHKRAICRCQSGFKGTPPNCRQECTLNSECASDKACLNRKCVDPCVYQCARNANCTVIAHNPICSCQDGFAGDPLSNCMPQAIPTQRPAVNSCIPSLCGPYSKCQEFNGNARCICLPNYSSSPPRCGPECTYDFECNADKACIDYRCSDPCPAACGNYAECIVKNHIPYCTCLPESCQALDQTFDFPRYPELGYNIRDKNRRRVSRRRCEPKIRLCESIKPTSILNEYEFYFRFLDIDCPRGTLNPKDFCVETDDDNN